MFRRKLFLVLLLAMCSKSPLAQVRGYSPEDVYVKKTEMRDGKKTDIYIIEKDDKSYQIETVGAAVINFKIDGVEIPKSEIHKYDAQIKALRAACENYIKTHTNAKARESENDEAGLKVKVNEKVSVRLYDEDIANIYESSKKAGAELLNKIKGIFR